MRLSQQLILMTGFLAGVIFMQFARPIVLVILLAGGAYALATYLWNRRRSTTQ